VLLFSFTLTRLFELGGRLESSTTVVALLALKWERFASGLTLFLGSEGVSQALVLML